MPSARNSAALKRPAWMKGVVNSVTFTMNRFARRAVLTRSSTVNNNCVVTLKDIATFNALNNRWELIEDYTLPSNCTLTINENEILIIDNGKRLNNNGTITNNGTIENNGGTIVNFGGGTITNNGGEINNQNGGEIFNQNGGAIVNFGGEIINQIGGIINNQNGGTINNSGGIIITNSGIFSNNGTIFNGDVINCPTGTIIGPITGVAPMTQCAPPHKLIKN